MKSFNILFATGLVCLTPLVVLATETSEASSALSSVMQLSNDQQDEIIAKVIDSRKSHIPIPRSGARLSRMPTAVGSPSYAGLFKRSTSATLTFWRENVDGKARLFVQVQPTTAASFFFCSSSSYSVFQNTVDFGKAFRITRGDDQSFCDNVKTTEIFLVDQWDSYDNFNEQGAFTFTASDRAGTIEVGAASGNTSPTPVVTPPVTGNCSTTGLTVDDLPIIYSNLDIDIPLGIYIQNSGGFPPKTTQVPVWASLKYVSQNGSSYWILQDAGVHPE